MKIRIAILWSSVLIGLTAFAQSSHTATKVDFDKWMKQLSNWGRWGKDDQRGTVNLITPAKVKQAASLAKQGITVSMEHPLMTEAAADNANPLTHTMTATGANPVLGAYAMDSYAIAFHGYG